MARIYIGKGTGLNVWFAPVEKMIYGLSGIDPKREMSWKQYAFALMLFNIIGIAVVYAIQRFQNALTSESDGHGAGSAGPGFKYSGKLCQQYKLAKLWRWNDFELFYSSCGIDRTEFPFRGYSMAVMVALLEAYTKTNKYDR